MYRHSRLVLVLVACLSAQRLVGQEAFLAPRERGKADPDLPFIAITQVEKAPAIDGKLDDPCWKAAPESAIFMDEYGFPVKTRTTFQICQQGDVLFIALRAGYDPASPPKEISTNTKLHDGDFWQGEALELFLDPDNDDTPGYYQFALSPEGVTGDFFCAEPRDAEARWEPKYQVKLHWTPKEWTAEWALPLALFDRTKTRYENFGLNVFRYYQGTPTWSPPRGEGFHYPHRFGEARGLKGTDVKANVAGKFREPLLRVNDRVIHAKAKPTLIPAEKPTLVSGPTIKPNANGYDIAFKVNTWTDVAVWIEDARGERVRHLAAGMLGPNPPQPLQAKSLEQTLRWDMRDDLGNKLPAGAYKVQVGVGSKASLDRVIGRDVTPMHIQGMAIDAKGRLYIVGGVRDEWTEVQRFDRDGKYQAMLFPPPANLPPEKLKGLNIIDFGADGQVRFGSHRTAAYLPHLDQPMPHTPLVNGKGQVIIFGGEYQGGPARFYKINADGSLPDDFLGPYVKEITWQQYFAEWGKRFHFALDPADENVIWLSGLKEVHRAEYGEEGKIARETHYNAIARVRWGQEGPLDYVLGKKNHHGKAGSKANAEFDDPQGIAFDKAGNVWVCDRGNDRVQIFDKSGKYLRQFPHRKPYEVRHSQKTGAAYILSNDEGNVTLTKFVGDKPTGKPIVVGKLTKSHGGTTINYWTMVLDETGPNAELKIVRGDKTDAYEIDRVVDLGTSFAPPERIIGMTPPREYRRLAVGWETEDIWAGGHCFDGKTGAYLGEHVGDQVTTGRDGNWFTYGGFFAEEVGVYPPEWLRVKNTKALHKWRVEPVSLSRGGGGTRGFCVAPNGDVYVARYYQWQQHYSGRGGMEGSDLHVAIDRYSPAGKMLRQRVVYELSHGAAGPAVDIKGNIYVTDNVGRKIGQLYEDDIAENLPSWVPHYDVDWDKIRKGEPIALGYEKFVQNPLIRSVGTLYKFGPEGGGLLFRAAWGEYKQYMPEPDPKNPTAGKYLDWGFPFKPKPTSPATHWSATWIAPDKLHGMYPRWQDGVHWEFLGVGPVWGRYNKGHSSCVCGNSRISVDDFGRVYAPAAHRSTVRMIDTAGNEVLRIGRWGNMDSYGPQSPVPDPEIPLMFPSATALSKNALFITEWRHARILKVRLHYHQQGQAEVRVN